MDRTDDPRERLRILGEAFARISGDESAFNTLGSAIRTGDRETFDEVAGRFIPKWLEREFWCWPTVNIIGDKHGTAVRHYEWTATGAELTFEELQQLKSINAQGKTFLDYLMEWGIIRTWVEIVEPVEQVTGEWCFEEVKEGPIPGPGPDPGSL